ncbi:UNKNOWN [Stylonychia lemnae]|uniref:Uncharacterized protein n=1 Tax=Stylonychia lemnae TaxID=5949 RepID=A0A077ZXS9_STYLE|nr:UNKNOWN [Stylonychia lemnae]|eukprot:CDW74387.1 UNKNOWN [Stylonychia lemnae]
MIDDPVSQNPDKGVRSKQKDYKIHTKHLIHESEQLLMLLEQNESSKITVQQKRYLDELVYTGILEVKFCVECRTLLAFKLISTDSVHDKFLDHYFFLSQYIIEGQIRVDQQTLIILKEDHEQPMKDLIQAEMLSSVQRQLKQQEIIKQETRQNKNYANSLQTATIRPLPHLVPRGIFLNSTNDILEIMDLIENQQTIQEQCYKITLYQNLLYQMTSKSCDYIDMHRGYLERAKLSSQFDRLMSKMTRKSVDSFKTKRLQMKDIIKDLLEIQNRKDLDEYLVKYEVHRNDIFGLRQDLIQSSESSEEYYSNDYRSSANVSSSESEYGEGSLQI